MIHIIILKFDATQHVQYKNYDQHYKIVLFDFVYLLNYTIIKLKCPKTGFCFRREKKSGERGQTMYLLEALVASL
jgi:hypothetical protein